MKRVSLTKPYYVIVSIIFIISILWYIGTCIYHVDQETKLCTEILTKSVTYNCSNDFYTNLKTYFEGSNAINYFSDLSGNETSFIILLMPLIMFFIGVTSFHYKVNTNYAIYNFSREEYKKKIKKELFNSYKSALFIPFLSFIVLLFSILITKDISFSLMNPFVSWINNIYLFLIVQWLSLFILGLVYINIGIIVSYISRKYIISAIITYIVSMVISLFGEIVLFNFINGSGWDGVFALTTYWGMGDQKPFLLSGTLYVSILFVITFVPLYFIYRNKERVIINASK